MRDESIGERNTWCLKKTVF